MLLPKPAATFEPRGVRCRSDLGTGLLWDTTARVGDRIRWNGTRGSGLDRPGRLSRTTGRAAKLGWDSNESLGLESLGASNARFNQELRRKLNWDGIELRSAQPATKRVHHAATKDTKKSEPSDRLAARDSDGTRNDGTGSIHRTSTRQENTGRDLWDGTRSAGIPTIRSASPARLAAGRRSPTLTAC